MFKCISLSTIVLNSRSEIVWFPKISRFKNQPCNRLYPKKTAGIHWLGYNDAVSWLNGIFQPTANFEIFKIYLYFICLPASLPAVRPGFARCRAPEILHDEGNGSGFTKMLFRRRFTHCAMAIPFILPYSFNKVRISPSKVSIACYGFYLLRHINKPGLHVI